ncbi:hypothetical protein TNCV_4806241 [Trichonephila clavipes]|nr:hypothetical protein TNCV_4806241 [Trichonephila clavipes]
MRTTPEFSYTYPSNYHTTPTEELWASTDLTCISSSVPLVPNPRYADRYPSVGHVIPNCPMLKVTELECHEFEPSTTEDPPSWGGYCTLNLQRLECHLSVMGNFGEENASLDSILAT